VPALGAPALLLPTLSPTFSCPPPGVVRRRTGRETPRGEAGARGRPRKPWVPWGSTLPRLPPSGAPGACPEDCRGVLQESGGGEREGLRRVERGLSEGVLGVVARGGGEGKSAREGVEKQASSLFGNGLGTCSEE